MMTFWKKRGVHYVLIAAKVPFGRIVCLEEIGMRVAGFSAQSCGFVHAGELPIRPKPKKRSN